MATPLDIGLLKQFGVIFPFLFVFIIAYVVFLKTKFFEDNKGLASLLALVLAMMVLFSPIVRDTISRMAPWFVLLFIFSIFAMIGFMIFGATEKDVFSALKNEKYGFNVWILAIVIIIILGSLTSVISERGGIGKTPAEIPVEDGNGAVSQAEQTSEFWETIVNPKVLGLILLLMIASFTVRFMTAK